MFGRKELKTYTPTAEEDGKLPMGKNDHCQRGYVDQTVQRRDS